MPIFIPDIFGGYIKGRQQAINDNWSDLKEFNTVLNGQLTNARNMATFDPSVRNAWNIAAIGDMDRALSADTADRQLLQSSLEQNAGLPQLASQARVEEIQARIKQIQMDLQKAQAELQVALNQSAMTGGTTTGQPGTFTPPSSPQVLDSAVQDARMVNSQPTGQTGNLVNTGVQGTTSQTPTSVNRMNGTTLTYQR